ncbi:MAG: response regulator transcription factor [Deltaproteobacteria bacterium]|nr:response regulator transcription factor [Deltaproteobacteria bacterium]MBW1873389.1 response regulator transcription factor [Deltaproteobacteria bacterium]
MKATILVVEDDSSIAKGLEQNLRYEGYSVFCAPDGERGLELAIDKQPDLVLLDVMMPKMNGFEVLREMRRREIDIPVIMLTAKGEETDKVRGLDMGADDYVTKPFGLHELLARVQAVLRRKQRLEQSFEQASFGDVKIDFSARTAEVSGQPITLTTKEFDLIHLFLSREGQALDRQEILNRVWGFDYFGTDRTVDNFINRLRQKLEQDPNKPVYFQTVRGIGYRFCRKEKS